MKKYINVLNVLACIAVVFIHTSEAFWIFSYEPYWLFANIIHCASLFCVPIFFMISGCNLIDYREKYSTIEFFKKRFIKTFIPFAGWSFIALISAIITKKCDISSLSLSYIISIIFNCKYIGIYWFFIALFSVYLCIPAISSIPENKRKKTFLYILIMWFTFNTALPFTSRLLNIEWNNYMKFPLATDYMFYIIAGYYIGNYNIKKYYRYIIYVLGIIGMSANIILTYKYSYEAASVAAPVGDYLSITTLLYSIAVFTLFRYMPEKITCKLNKFCAPISKFTFGVYLSHIYFWFFIKYSNFLNYLNPFVMIFGGIISFTAAIIVTIVMKKIPYIKMFVP